MDEHSGFAGYAGFWKRFAAFIIDSILLSVVSGFLKGSGAFFFAIFGSWLYYALMESSAKQATLGKMALGIIVTDMEGKKVSFGKATGRYAGKFLSLLTLFIGFIMAGFTKKKQALHDIIAGCVVVNKK